MLSLIKKQVDVDKIYLYTKDLIEPKYEILIKKRENTRTRQLSDSNSMDDIYNNIYALNSTRKRGILIVFDDLIADIMTNKQFQAIIKQGNCRKLVAGNWIYLMYLSCSLIFCSQRSSIKPYALQKRVTKYCY